ncbi:Protein-N(5)-glutamine methyltransferase PrmB, methylates LSU ribosomal protein L3p [Marinobacterium lacunae]|uniref:Ribosomal protein uL3 glutamine methyltransferase n=1 Tax=Marinobacterium lacunae TaxID=1232683 RepID=A0A081FZ57_9GAMM|nr:50S ribosomal protein L3 N(5)-glutamine methyltransferase [Marinobacterium lacunae]KEA63812.1 Protein-N(5)-glutamine methyltransferase PrmB, methylates LSU ribosomal protein L3p [Marinobacterium lacunae]
MNLDQASLLEELETLRDFVRFSLSAFHENGLYFGHGTDNAWDEAVQLVLNAVHLPWDTRPEVLDAKLTRSEKRRVLEYLRQRVEERKPLPYITGEAWFMGLAFNVDERVLIPRSPIAELIENEYEPWLRPGPVSRVLDLCTGSGCIGIATALVFREACVDLVDISEEALAVAGSNIKRHQLADRVEAVESDLFEALDPSRPYDLIVSNPPYVDAQDLASMPQEYRHEPDLALGSGADGLDITRRILREAGRYLTDDGLLVVEVGNSEVHLMEQYPDLPLVWVELEMGGNGVFCITAQELRQYADKI